jgi:hypothetical protein
MAAAAGVDPSKIFVQADCFYTTLAILCNVNPNDMRLAVTIGEPVMVLGALTIELFLKCLLCIESGDVPRGHNLKELFEKLSPTIRGRIEDGWSKIAAHRGADWDGLEASMAVTIARDLPSALAVAGDTFQKLRYSYEGNTERLQYYLQDLPRLLGRIVLEIRPEWEDLRRNPQPLPPRAHH